VLLVVVVVVNCKPLMDNLESHTYEVFEKDPVKYSQYQKAIFCALRDRVPDSEAETRVTYVIYIIYLVTFSLCLVSIHVNSFILSCAVLRQI